MPDALRRTLSCRRPTVLMLALATVLTAAMPAAGQDSPSIDLPKIESRDPAPDFPDGFTWLNTDRRFSLEGNLSGHVVILDFWTYCCINCMHVQPDLKYIEDKYEDEPVAVIGVHSAKFKTERNPENIRQAVQRYRIHHPVLVDENHRVWDAYGVRAWPTFMIIDSAGRVVGRLTGEDNRALLDTIVARLLKEGRARGTLAESPVDLYREPTPPTSGPLAFPGKIAADPARNRLFVADSTNDRILAIRPDGKVLRIIGSGERGFDDGPLDQAAFHNPQGMAVDGQTLYVADTDNHALRRVDLQSERVETIAGTGKRSYDREGGKKGTEQGLASPWALALKGKKLYIAMAGTHQLWVHDLNTGVSEQFSGSGRERLSDGPAATAALAQPSGLTIHDGWLYFADSEVSALRKASLDDGRVRTLIGKGLFEFGHKDGPFGRALMQHALGVAAHDGDILVADTYNNALRRADLDERQITTIHGGPDRTALDEPGGLTVLDGRVYIADTNHHRIVRFDPETGKGQPLKLKMPAE